MKDSDLFTAFELAANAPHNSGLAAALGRAKQGGVKVPDIVHTLIAHTGNIAATVTAIDALNAKAPAPPATKTTGPDKPPRKGEETV